MALKDKRWETDTTWVTVPIEVLKFCRGQGGKRLEINQYGVIITQRAYSIIGFLTPALAVCFGMVMKASSEP